MPKFTYTAKSLTTGNISSGDIMGGSQNEVILKLQQQNLIPVTITEVSMKSQGSLFQRMNDKVATMSSGVKFKDVVFFTRQMVTFLNAGVIITKAIKNIADSQKSLAFQKILYQIYDDINSGTDFSMALAKHPKVFPGMYINIVRAGEATGKMDTCLAKLAQYMEKTQEMNNAIKSSMMYPKFIGIFMAIIVFIIMWKIVPVFQDLFASMGGELPGPTRMLIYISDIIQNYFFIVIGLCIGLYYLNKWLFTKKSVLDMWDKFRINVPIFGDMVQKIILSRLSSTFALLLEAGAPMIQSMEIAAKAADNHEYEVSMNSATSDVKNGVEIAIAMKRTNRFPDVMIQLIQTGEETGRIGELMQKIANMYDEEVSLKIKGFSSLIEPLLIVVMGVVIGSIVVAIYLPIFSMGKNFQ